MNPMPNNDPRGTRTDPAGVQKKQYYEATKAWDIDRLRYALVARNRAYVLAIIATVLAIAGVVTVAVITPLKTVDMVVFSYDEKTGSLVRVKTEGMIEKFTGDEAYINNQIYEFVLARETWDAADYQERRNKLNLIMDKPVLDDYRKEFGEQLKTLGPGGRKSVRINAISFLPNTPQTVLVHLSTETRPETGNPEIQEWKATVGYRFTQRPTDIPTLSRNPFGFQVTSYRRDQVLK